MNEPLKQCPFCGKEAYRGDRGLVQCITYDCPANGGWAVWSAVKTWNRRAPDPLMGLVRELQRELLHRHGLPYTKKHCTACEVLIAAESVFADPQEGKE